MITVDIQQRSIEITGHAGAGPPGYDIVCSAVSVLIQTLAQSLIDLTEDHISAQFGKGAAKLEWESLSRSGRLLVDSFYIGINGVISAYPECVQINGGSRDQA